MESDVFSEDSNESFEDGEGLVELPHVLPLPLFHTLYREQKKVHMPPVRVELTFFHLRQEGGENTSPFGLVDLGLLCLCLQDIFRGTC